MRSQEKVLNRLYSVEGCDLEMQGSAIFWSIFFIIWCKVFGGGLRDATTMQHYPFQN